MEHVYVRITKNTKDSTNYTELLVDDITAILGVDKQPGAKLRKDLKDVILNCCSNEKAMSIILTKSGNVYLSPLSVQVITARIVKAEAEYALNFEKYKNKKER